MNLAELTKPLTPMFIFLITGVLAISTANSLNCDMTQQEYEQTQHFKDSNDSFENGINACKDNQQGFTIFGLIFPLIGFAISGILILKVIRKTKAQKRKGEQT